jgi:hypothetical protein
MLRVLKAIEAPRWLTGLTPSAIANEPLPLGLLLDHSLFYPSCGFDDDPIRHFRGNIFSFVYCDYGHRLDEFMRALWFGGYNLLASRLVNENELPMRSWRPVDLSRTDGDPLRHRDHIKTPFCVWAVFERRPDRPITFGPDRFSLLFLCADGVAAFQALYVANAVAPKVVAVIQPGAAFGYNWTDFQSPTEIFARSVLENPGGQPDMLLFGDAWGHAESRWLEYQHFLRRYSKRRGGAVGVWAKNVTCGKK